MLTAFFPNIVESQSEDVVRDDVDVGKSSNGPVRFRPVQGKLVESTRRIQNQHLINGVYQQTTSAHLDLRKPIRRQIGERMSGAAHPAQSARCVIIQFEMADQIDILNRRMNGWAARR
ncbi:hypothetical protein [Pantoea stewartii]|uniref:hypothetical protein n=1 Tax=Pantoea stewartii TaxID=66269 RepID=UPI003625E478